MTCGSDMQIRASSSTLRFCIVLLFVMLFVCFMYTFLHEAGHAITGFVFGQSLTEFNVNFWDLSAHVGIRGGNLTQSQLIIRSVAGVSLSFLVWGMFISLVPRKAIFILEVLKLISSILVINTLVAWIVLPVLFLLGKAPPDDVTSFLGYSQMPPLLLMLTAIILYAYAWVLFLSKINGFRNEFLLFRTINSETLTKETRKSISLMGTALATCLLFTFLFNYSASKNPLDTFSPPDGFASVVEVDLSTQAYSAEILAEFTVEKPTYV